jgi:hypothetical protein
VCCQLINNNFLGDVENSWHVPNEFRECSSEGSFKFLFCETICCWVNVFAYNTVELSLGVLASKMVLFMVEVNVFVVKTVWRNSQQHLNVRFVPPRNYVMTLARKLE